MTYKTRHAKVQARIDVVRTELAAHDSNLALLEAAAEGRLCLKGKATTRAAAYCQTPEDKARLPRTLANVNAQRALLLKELDVLLEYGA